MQIETLKQVLKYLEAYEITRPATYKHLQNLSETMQDIKNEIKSYQTIELNDDSYISLYSDMAEAFLNDTFEGQMHVIAANGDQSYTEPAQDRFNEICGLVTDVLDDNNIVQAGI